MKIRIHYLALTLIVIFISFCFITILILLQINHFLFGLWTLFSVICIVFTIFLNSDLNTHEYYHDIRLFKNKKIQSEIKDELLLKMKDANHYELGQLIERLKNL